MTLLIPAATSSTTDPRAPLGVELGVKYEVIAPDGSRIVLNDKTDSDFVGYVTALSGIDSPEIREVSDFKTADDGATHGTFYMGRRTMAISGTIYSTDPTTRNDQTSRLQRAFNALRSDGYLKWQTTGGEPVQIAFRNNEPLRIDGGVSKTFQVGIASEDPRIYAQSETSVAVAGGSGSTTTQYPGLLPSPLPASGWDGQVLLQTRGNGNALPIITIAGPATIPTSGGGWRILNATTGFAVESITDASANLSAGESLTIDYALREVTHSSYGSWYDKINFVQTDWDGLAAGVNDLRFFASGTTSSTAFRVSWRDAWL